MSTQPKYREIYEELTRAITSGTFAAGEKLPTEQSLAERFGVARQTVLKALDAMKHDGVITSERGRGTFVAVTHGRRRTADTRQLVFICSNLEDSIGHRILLGVESAARRAGYSLVTCNTRNDSEREGEALRRARNTGVDGIVLIPYLQRPNTELLNRITEEIPLVCIDNVPPGVSAPLVTPDNQRSAYEAVSYLIDSGHRKIGFILSKWEYVERSSSISDRYLGYRKALEDHGIEFRPEYVTDLGAALADSRPRDIGLDLYGYPAMNRLMNCPEPPTAVVLLWDELAPGALAAIRDGRCRAPEDFSLVGFNDDELCTLVTPKLSSVRQPAEELGETAVQMLEKQIRGETPPLVTRLPNRLILRESITHPPIFETISTKKQKGLNYERKISSL